MGDSHKSADTPGGKSFTLKALGERIEQARKLRGLDQAGLSALLGVGRAATVSDWETGRKAISGETLARLPEVLNINGHWLLTGEGLPEQMSEADARQLLSRIQGLLLKRLDVEDPGGTAGGSSPPDADPPKE